MTDEPYARGVPVRNVLYYGDNLDVLQQHVADESVDLVYLDPPFNSNATYNVLFKTQSGHGASAQLQAFDDTWHWSPACDEQYRAMLAGSVPPRVSVTIEAMHRLLADRSDMLAYLVMMAPRMVELHRVLKSTGSMYLHCDPTASHYLKLVLDAVFGPERFLNEVVWKRATTVKGNFGQGSRKWAPNTDSLLVYAKTDGSVFNPPFKPYTDSYVEQAYRHVEPGSGRRYRLVSMIGPGGAAKGNPQYEVLGVTRYWRYSKEKMQQLIDSGLVVQSRPGAVPNHKYYLDEGKGVPVQSLWDDIPNLQAADAERLGYPTQKPIALLERIITASSNPGDVVLDPFCGCGTTVDAAQRLDRRWIGIDITYVAVDLIRKRLFHTYGPGIETAYEVHGIPTDREGAAALFAENPFDFERWAVSLVSGTPNDKQIGDRGIDGRIRFYGAGGELCTAIVSVKGGQTVPPTFARDLVGTMTQARAEMGLLVTQVPPSRGVQEVADRAGTYVHEPTGASFPRLQVLTVDRLLKGERPKMPTPLTPYIKAASRQGEQQQLFRG
jgi:DNA modification methylase